MANMAAPMALFAILEGLIMLKTTRSTNINYSKVMKVGCAKIEEDNREAVGICGA
jgi:hypothetical protein